MNIDWEERYKNFDHHVISYLEQRYGDSESAKERGEVYLKSIIKYSKDDSRALFFWLAWNVPFMKKIVYKHEYTQRLRTDHINYAITDRFLKLAQWIINESKEIHPEGNLTLNKIFTGNAKIDWKIWLQCLKSKFPIVIIIDILKVKHYEPEIIFDGMQVSYKGKIIKNQQLNISKIFDIYWEKLDLYYHFVYKYDEE